jgi:hypothetical protein
MASNAFPHSRAEEADKVMEIFRVKWKGWPMQRAYCLQQKAAHLFLSGK